MADEGGSVRKKKAAQLADPENWWKKASNLLFFQPREPTPSQAQGVKVDPKAFFSAERTLYKWIHFAIVLISIGGALITVEYTNPTGVQGDGGMYTPIGKWNISRISGVNGLVLELAALAVLCYSLFVFHYRMWGFANKRSVWAFDDKYGPTILMLLLGVLIVINGVLYASKSRPGCIDYGSFVGGAEFQPTGLTQTKPNTFFAIGPTKGLVELETTSLRVRQWLLKSCVDVTGGPSTDPPAVLYILQQSPPAVLQFNTYFGEVLQSWALPLVPPPEISDWSLSTITFVPDSNHFLVGTTGDGTIYEVLLPLTPTPAGDSYNNNSTEARVLSSFKPSSSMLGLSGLHYHIPSKQLYGILDTSIVKIDYHGDQTVSSVWPMLYRTFGGLHIDNSEQGLFVSDISDGVIAHVPFSQSGPALCPGLMDPIALNLDL
mmetsp:Transcript_10423/g.17040  ORF Transcript_10423/g.17040 Transcript_10423/m.17040 type:complete len:433 (+) Transcript_10423:72-1370(+)|eukprot:CAMPEP_0184659178 /NCGR_PEP_ID=MMETSP0308-20130426/28570_1 /TAXON_ID=38269 /ORGANISM="Gloeochaete witrockiana, Strain SAG 46.84" /LENGTH=432 /DNA_ID=CAMNT_0027098783 /DNA_START=59 /DNA_END=1357 /DNA_ORIENTATION=+